nr:type VI secretion system protein TssA [uncultured Noviherbaspirillum sp.]
MRIVDVEALLQDLSEAEPSGPNLEYDPAFFELEQAALGKPEVQYGDTITPAVPPEWKVVKKLALDLLGRTRDLRVAVPLLRSLLSLHGLPGFADGSQLIQSLVSLQWDSVHPQLDPDDDLDPMLRVNSLASLVDGATMLRELKDAVLVQLPGLGPLTLRTLEMASGELPTPEGQTAVSLATLEAGLRDADPEVARSALEAATAAHNHVVELELELVRRIGSSQALNLDPLVRNLRRIRDFLGRQEGADDSVVETGEGSDGADGADGGSGAVRRQPSAGISGDIESRADVVRMLDKILLYYARHEPSSPVPMLLERAKRLAPKTFFEILEDLAPDSLDQVALIRGRLPEQDAE